MTIEKRLEKLEKAVRAREPRRETGFWELATEREAQLYRRLWDVGGRKSAEALVRLRAQAETADEGVALEIEDPIIIAADALGSYVERRKDDPDLPEFDISELPDEVQKRLAEVGE